MAENPPFAQWAHDGFLDLLISGAIPALRVEFFIRPDYKSASWRFRPPHTIVLGDRLLSNMLNPSTKTIDQKSYFMAFLRHELAHALWTERDIPRISQKLQELGIPFALYNLFEDARIEEKMRQSSKKLFGWLKYEPLPAVNDDPLSLFFFLLQSEHQRSYLAQLGDHAPTELKPHANKIWEFYTAACAAESSWEVINVLQAWIEHFGLQENIDETLNQMGGLFAQESETMNDPQAFEALLEGAESTARGDRQGSGEEGKEETDQESSHLLADTPYQMPFSVEAAKTLEELLAPLLQNIARQIATHTPSKRLNRRALIDDDRAPYRKKVTPLLVPKTLTLVVDLSGSMAICFEEMRLILEAVNRLSHAGILKGWVVLSGVDRNTPINQEFALPLSPDVFHRIVPQFASEGLAHALRSHKSKLQQSDFIWILTDGLISDEPIDRQGFRQLGVRIGGVYMGEPAHKDHMSQWFDYTICEPTVERLAEAILREIKK